MRLMIFGSKGQTGLALVCLAKRRGVDFIGLDLDEIDISDQKQVDEAVADFKPTHMINAAAYNSVDAAEEKTELAFAVNALAPGCLALAARRTGAVLVHYSTDYVFDGTKESDYIEQDEPNPLSAYARSKLLGEKAVLISHPESYLLRTSWVFGPGGSSFVSRVLKLASEKLELSFVDDQLCTPTYAPDLARVSLELIDRKAPFGLYHAVGSEVLTPYSWAKKILTAAGIDKKIVPVPASSFKTKAKRPARSVLSTAKLGALGISIPGCTARLSDYFAGRTEVKP